MNADYPHRFIDSIINQSISKKNGQDDYLIPSNLFEIPKTLVLIKIPYCLSNEITPKRFLRRFCDFTGNWYDVRIKWNTEKVKQLFKLKSKSSHPSCAIHEGVCTIQDSHIGETKRNVEIRREEHQDTSKDLELTKYPNDKFSWKMLMTTL